jgi:hypothetical protein
MEAIASSSRSAASKSHVTGFIVIHSAPAALRPHIEWGLQSIVGNWLSLEWKSQPKATGTFRTTVEFRDRKGTAAKITTALKAWHYLRFEVREESEMGGEFFRFVPELGLHRSTINEFGSISVSEELLIQSLKKSFDEDSLREEIERVLGTAWELALEPFRGVEFEEAIALKAI